MQIDLIQEDIDRGKPRQPWGCPLALALRRQTGLPWQIAGGLAWIDRPLTDPAIVLDEAAVQFESDFDAGLPVKPFSFEFPFEEENPCASK